MVHLTTTLFSIFGGLGYFRRPDVNAKNKPWHISGDHYFWRPDANAENKPLFLAAGLLAAENSLFSTARCHPPKIMTYFRLIFFCGL
jgi:hypothetical protein